MNGIKTLDFSQVEDETVAASRRTLDLDTVRPRFEDYKKEAVRIAADAKALTVTDQESLGAAVTLGGNAKKIAKAVDLQRKQIITEPQDFIKGVNGICNMITEALDEAERMTKQKIGQHQARVEMERLERERKARDVSAALQRKLDEEAAAANMKAREEARKRAEEESRVKREKEEVEAKERGAKKAELEALAKKQEEERLEAIRKAREEAKTNEIIAPTVVAPIVQEAPRVTRTESGSAFSKKPWVFEVTNEAEVEEKYKSLDEKKIRDAIKMGLRDAPGLRIYQDTQINFRA
ncbi:MAG: hypothetical protein ABIJ57_14750 [Pseudomonadota bacterium]